MKNVITAAALLLLLSACTKHPVVQAGSAECETACKHVADLRMAKQIGLARGALHDLDEAVDATEASSKTVIAQMQTELAQGGPPWNPQAFEKLPAATRRDLAERHRWAANQLKQQRERSILQANDAVTAVKKTYEDTKKKSEADEKQATAEAFKTCSDSCIKSTQPFAQCLQRTQAPEDIASCEHQYPPGSASLPR